MSTIKQEYYEQRLNEATSDLYDTVTNYQRMMIARAIDISLFFTGLFLVSYILIETTWVPNLLLSVGLLIYIILAVILRGLLHGNTIGYYLMNIRFINVKTKKRVSLHEYFQYIRKTTKLEVRYTQIFKYYLSFDERYIQNQPMKKYGMVVVDSRKYKRFYRDYQNNIENLKQLQQS